MPIKPSFQHWPPISLPHNLGQAESKGQPNSRLPSIACWNPILLIRSLECNFLTIVSQLLDTFRHECSDQR